MRPERFDRSGLILDCAIPKGNPADSTWTVSLLQRQTLLFGQPPRQASFDGAFASTDNLADAKALGVEDVCLTGPLAVDLPEISRTGNPSLLTSIVGLAIVH
jgi:transposase, IS5 family